MSHRLQSNVVINFTYFKPKLQHCYINQATLLVKFVNVAFCGQKGVYFAANLMRRCNEVTLILKPVFCGFIPLYSKF